MKISRELAIKILKYLNKHKNFYFPFLVVCKEYTEEDGDFVEIEPEEWRNIAEDNTYQTFELWENLQNLDEETLRLMSKGFIEKIESESADKPTSKTVKKYKVEITETLQRVIDVEAKDSDEALDKIRTEYKQEKIVLDEGDFVEVEFNNFNLFPVVFKITGEEIISHFEELKRLGKIPSDKRMTKEKMQEILDSVECDEFLAKDIRNSIKSSIQQAFG